MMIRTRIPAVALVTALSTISAAQAEQSSGQASQAGQLQEVIVTATKRRENVEKVPISIAVATATQLQQRGIADPSDLNFIAPDLQKQQQSSLLGAANFFIRGVGTATFGNGVEPSVSIVIDGVVMARPEMGVVNYFDLDHIEVLRGPQGMLFGMNASAGLVNIATAEPEIGRFQARARAEYGKNDNATPGNEERGDAVLNLPITDDSAVRISGFTNHQDGPVKDIYANVGSLGFAESGVRAKYLWEPSDSWSVLLEGDYATENGAYNSFYTRRFDAPGGFAQSQDAALGITPSPNNLYIASNGPTFGRFSVGGTQANVRYTFGDGYTLTNIAAIRRYTNHSGLDADEFPVAFYDDVLPNFFDRQVSDELRLASPTGRRLDYQVGLFYLHVRAEEHTILCGDLEPFAPAPPPGTCNLGSDYDIVTYRDNSAAYGQATYSITRAFRVTAGGRYTVAKLDDLENIQLGQALSPIYAVGRHEINVTDRNFSWRAGLEYDFTPSIMGYVTDARGFKASGIAQNATYAVGPETSTDYEAGLKSTLFDRRLRLNLDVYRETFYGYQATSFVESGGVSVYELANAATLRTQGVEADFSAIPTTGLTVSGGAAYDDAYYLHYAGVQCYPFEPTGLSGTNVCLPNGSTDVSGDQLALAPKWTFTLAVHYERPITSRWDAELDANDYYRSSFSYDPTRDPNMRDGALNVVGASIGVISSDDRWEAIIFGRNIFNRHYPSQIRPDTFEAVTGDVSKGGDYWQAFDQSAFRTIGVSFEYRY